jgi:hypothetical protein
MSFESRGWLVAVRAPATTQLLEPGWQPAQAVGARACWRARRSSGLVRDAAGWGGGGGAVAPGADGEEVSEKLGAELGRRVRSEAGGEGFAVEFFGEAVGEVLEHDEGDEDAVAGGPGFGLIAEDAELDGEVRAHGVDGGVDTEGVDLEGVELVGRELRDRAVGGGADLEGALQPIVREKARSEDLGEFAGGVAAKGVHLEEAIAGGDEALGKD